jgi:hypothetical protein
MLFIAFIVFSAVRNTVTQKTLIYAKPRPFSTDILTIVDTEFASLAQESRTLRSRKYYRKE